MTCATSSPAATPAPARRRSPMATSTRTTTRVTGARMWWWTTRWNCARCWITRCAVADGLPVLLTYEDPMWEGGLPPIAVVQSMNVLNDTLQSGASPLPHWIFSVFQLGVGHLLNFVEAIYV